jgi:hypothetical protein
LYAAKRCDYGGPALVPTELIYQLHTLQSGARIAWSRLA